MWGAGLELNFQGGDLDKEVISGRIKSLNRGVARGKVNSRYEGTGRSLIGFAYLIQRPLAQYTDFSKGVCPFHMGDYFKIKLFYWGVEVVLLCIYIENHQLSSKDSFLDSFGSLLYSGLPIPFQRFYLFIYLFTYLL